MNNPQSSAGHTPHNPYEFITNPTTPTKKPLLAGGSKQGKIFVIVGLLTVIVGLLALVASLTTSSVSEEDYTRMLQQQAEIIRVSDLGLTAARDNATKNFIITVKETLQTQQTELTPLATATGLKVSGKLLAEGASAETDQQLTQAQQLNRYDETVLTILRDSLREYQQTLEQIYEGTSAEATKLTLSEAYNAVSTLTKDQSNSGTSDSPPATN